MNIRRIIIALILVISLVFTSVSFSFANGVYSSDEKDSNILGDAYQRLDDVNTDKLADDIAVLETIGFDEDNIIGVSTNNDIEATKEVVKTEKVIGDTIDTDSCNTFAYQIADDIVSEITVVDETKDGGIVLDIVEGELNDVLFLDTNGDIYLDGNKVEYSTTSQEVKPNTLVPNYYIVGWDFSPIYPNTKSADYNKYLRTYSDSDIDFTKRVKDISLAAFSVIFTRIIKNWIAGVTVTITSFLIGQMKTLADRLAPNSRFASYRVRAYDSSKSTSSAQHTEYIGTIYMSTNFTGPSDSVSCYKKRTWIAK